MRSSFGVAAAALGFLPLAFAQTHSDCNPMTNTSCPADAALANSPWTSDFTQDSMAGWKATAGNVTGGSAGANGAAFTINERGDAPTIQSESYIFWGYVEVKMKAASGTGIVSSIVLESDTLDEVDWEFLGGNNAAVQTNYFGKGNTTSYDRMIQYPVTDVQGTSHTYAVNWTQEAIEWIVDGTAVRTLNYADANDGNNFPQTPMNVRIGIWAGGDPDNGQGTIEWAGGETDYTKTPFNMYVESVTVQNYSPGSEYLYTDQSGSYKSIQVKDSGSASGGSSSAAASGTAGAAKGTATGAAKGTATGATKGTATGDATADPIASVTATSTKGGKQLSGTESVTNPLADPTGVSGTNGTAATSTGIGGAIMSGLSGPGSTAAAGNGSTKANSTSSAGSKSGNSTASSSAALQTTNAAVRNGAGFAGAVVLGCAAMLL